MGENLEDAKFALQGEGWNCANARGGFEQEVVCTHPSGDGADIRLSEEYR